MARRRESRAKYGAELSGPIAKCDFISSLGAPAYLQPGSDVGTVAPAAFNSPDVLGSYGELLVIQSEFIPAGYSTVVATGGPSSNLNPVEFRQHTNTAYHGLRLFSGTVQHIRCRRASLRTSSA